MVFSCCLGLVQKYVASKVSLCGIRLILGFLLIYAANCPLGITDTLFVDFTFGDGFPPLYFPYVIDNVSLMKH